MHPINKSRSTNGEFHHHIPELKQDKERFNYYFKMKIETYYYILKIVKPDTKKVDIGCRSISSEKRFEFTKLSLVSTDFNVK